MTRCWRTMAAAVALLAAGAAWAQEDENPTTPGAIPSPSTYQGSMQLQQQSDRQDQQFRQQQQQPTYSQPSYNRSAGGPSYARPQPGASQPAEAPRVDAGVSQEPATPESLAADAANERGDYAEAIRLWRILAARGSANAQYNLGVNYDEGHGVPVNETAAAAWYVKAAEQGMGPAMGNFAAILVQRSQAAASLVEAYKWFTLAIDHSVAGPRGAAVSNRNILAQHMTRAEIDQALALARAWEAAHPAAAHYLKPESPAPSGPANAVLTIKTSAAGPGWMTPLPNARLWIMTENPTPLLATFGSASNPLDQLAADCRTVPTCGRDLKALTAKAVGAVKTDASGQGQQALAAGRYYVLGMADWQGKLVFWFRQVDVQAPGTTMNIDQTDGLVVTP